MGLMDRLSIRVRLLVINAATVGAVLTIMAVGVVVNEFFAARAAMLADLRVQARMIAYNAAAAAMFADWKSAEETLSALRASPHVRHADVLLDGKRPFAMYHRDATEPHGLTTHAPMHSGHFFSISSLEVHEPLAVEGNPIGVVRILADLTPIYERLLWYSLVVTCLTAAALAAGFALMNRLQKSITGPLMRLAEATRTLGREQDFSVRANVESGGEIGDLAQGFNTMVSQIQARDAELAKELAERKRAEERLHRLAHFDTVTNLTNRHYFNERLQLAATKATRFGEPMALMYLDLDNFKIINDTLGHHVGDMLLQVVADRLASTLRAGDTVSRIGGDEFAIILENLSSGDRAAQVAEKCLRALNQAVALEGHEIYVNASIGYCICPQDASDIHELLQNADTAMYQAKAGGKGRWQAFLPDMRGRALQRLTLETSLRRALEREEFVLYYQPQVDLPHGRVIAVEALIRWRHPELGMVSPADFIPVAEESGLIVPIGEWVLRTACRQAKAWQEAGTRLRVAVNLSARQFRDDALVDKVLGIVAESGLDPRLLELELTESTLMDVSDSNISRLYRLRDKGIQLSIDDFGTGYSSMSYLKRFPVGMLKVDRSFVRELPGNGDDAAITQAIVSMARSLQIEVIAEGVETSAQAEFLARSGCNHAQGFLFSPPVPVEEIDAILRGERPLAGRDSRAIAPREVVCEHSAPTRVVPLTARQGA